MSTTATTTSSATTTGRLGDLAGPVDDVAPARPTVLAATVVSTRRPRLTSDLRLGLAQVGFEQRAFWRNRSRAFFSVAFPLVFLVVFNAINGGDHIQELGGISYATWFVPGILAYGIIMATFTNLAVSMAISRDSGVLKRLRGTPLPTWVFMGARIVSTLVTALVLTVVTLALGVFAYDVDIRTSTLLGLVLTLVVGSVCFTTLGLAISTVIPNADAAPAITNVTILPLTFISGIWMVLAGAPSWLTTLAKVFPVRALAHGLQHAFDPATTGAGVVGTDLMVLGIWIVVGLVVIARRFRWESAR
jgi:ABC-2 type transport system permease protein